MRLQQDDGAGASSDALAATAVTYDLSCPFGVKTDACPHGSVHNENKGPVGQRVAAQLNRMRTADKEISDGPRASSATATKDEGLSAEEAGMEAPYHIRVMFSGESKLHMNGTQWCDTCCDGQGDFDASADGGKTYVNGTSVRTLGREVHFTVTLPGAPTHVRYTANQPFPQCAVYNTGGSKVHYPAYPFVMQVDKLVPAENF